LRFWKFGVFLQTFVFFSKKILNVFQENFHHNVEIHPKTKLVSRPLRQALGLKHDKRNNFHSLSKKYQVTINSHWYMLKVKVLIFSIINMKIIFYYIIRVLRKKL
jgi:hypothetical protein